MQQMVSDGDKLHHEDLALGGEAVANVGYALGRVAGKLVKATREKMSKT